MFSTTRNIISCNCRNKTKCTLENKCLVNNIIYKATVSNNITTEEKKNYIAIAKNSKRNVL